MKRFCWLVFVMMGLLLVGCHRTPAAPPPPSKTVNTTTEPWFVEVAAKVGVDFKHVNAATGRYFYPETNGSGCAFFDADGDGWMDILLVNGGRLPGYTDPAKITPGLYLNNRDGTFRNATAGSGLDIEFYGTGCCIGDYDNDGKPDIYIAAVNSSGHLFHNLGNGKFEDVTERAGVGNGGHWGTACCWIDYDRDGKLDLFVGNYIRYRLGSDAPCLYSEGYKTYCGPRWFQPDSPRLFRNLGDGTFRDVTAEAGLLKVKGKALGVSMLDYNHDGWPDLFVTNDVWENHLLENIANGKTRTFREVAVQNGAALSENGKTLAGMGVDVADLLGDGRLWVATANFSGEGIAIFRQFPGQEIFGDVSRQVGITQISLNTLGFGLTWVDTDNSGVKKLFAANGHVHPEVQKHQPHLRYEQPKWLFAWDGQGRFQDVTAQGGPALLEPTVSRGLAAGDYDNDGRMDVLANNLDRPCQLFHNVQITGNHWLGLQLEGRRSNRSGYGADVIVRGGSRTLHDFSRSGGSYISQSDPRLHFGLGGATQADEITVHWPSGATDVIRHVAADRYYHLVEGRNVVEPLHQAPRAPTLPANRSLSRR